MKATDRSAILRTSEAVAIGAAGAAGAWIAGLPVPYLIGPALAVTLAGLAGRPLQVADRLRNLCFIAIGLSLSQGITPDVIAQAWQWPASFLIMAVTLVAILYSCRWTLSRGWGFDRETALLASSPGHLSYVLGLSAGSKADLGAVSIIQSTRVLALTLLVPPLALLMGLPEPPAGKAAVELPVRHVMLLAACAAVLGSLLMRLRVPAALLIGGMIVSTGVHATGTVNGVMPSWLMIPAFVVMGTVIGTRFSGVTMASMRRGFGAGMVTTALSTVIAIAGAALASAWTGLGMLPLLVAYAPGGVETMAAIAVSLAIDPTFVAAHHVARLFFLSLLLPIALGRNGL